MTWAAICLVLAASLYLNVNVADSLYRLKYGPVRPSLLVDGWPVNAVEEDVVSAELRVNWLCLAANAAATLILALGTTAKVELWKRQDGTALRFTSEHAVTLGLLAVTLVALEIVNRSDSLVDPIDLVGALRWPAVSVLFLALCLTCRSFVDLLGSLAARRMRRQ
jgi:hypothetical protein